MPATPAPLLSIPPAPATTNHYRLAPTAAPTPVPSASSSSPLPFNILIADRGNNRIIEVTPTKQIVWSFSFPGLPAGFGADDAFFAPGNATIMANLEEAHIIVAIDYRTKRVVWHYGMLGHPGAGINQLNTPDDAYRLADGTTTVADIKNCRILLISLDKRMVKQYGHTRQCRSAPGFLNKPNGDTPLPAGHMKV